MRGRTVQLAWHHDPTAYAPASYRRACRYDAYIPMPLAGLELALDARVAGVVSDAEHAVRELNASARPALAPLARLLLRTESIASSKVEGLQVDVRDLARAEVRAETGRRANSTALEVLANIDAMQLAVDDAAASDELTVGHIVAVHQRLMAAAPNAHVAGRVRAEQNWIGGNDYNPCGAAFVPPPPEHVAELLEDLAEAVNDEAFPPLVQAALVHAQFETVHPFHDGNGRTGRALVQIVLRRRGVAPSYVPPISVVLAADRQRYIEGLTWYRQDRLDAWIEQFAAATARAAQLATAYLQAVSALVEHWRGGLRASAAPRADAAAWAVIDVLAAHPVITAPVAAAATGRAKAAIYQALKLLADAGVLEQSSAGARNQQWEAVGLLDLLARMESGRLPAR